MLLVVGRIGRAHGVLGETTIEVRTDLPEERFVVGAQLLADPLSHGPLTIDSTRMHNGILLLKFREINDRSAIEKIRDTLLLSDVEMSKEALFEDEYHVQQLIGCEIFDKEGTLLGELTDVLNLPGQDLLAIATPSGELLLPFIADFVPVVDVENRKIVINPPEGLLHLNDRDSEARKNE